MTDPHHDHPTAEDDRSTKTEREIPVPRAAGDARSSESTAGADSAMSATRAFEGSHKQTADTNVEELMALLSALAGGNSQFHEALNRLNAKRTYDEAQSTDLVSRVGSNDYRNAVQNLTVQALQNAVETANMVGKQAVAHRDIAINSQWTTDKEGFEAAVTAAVANAVNKK